MTPSTYEQLLGWLAPLISKESTKMRESIGASERLAVTLRYWVTGDAQTTIAASYRISRSTVCRIITETCDAEGRLFNLSVQGGRMERENPLF